MYGRHSSRSAICTHARLDTGKGGSPPKLRFLNSWQRSGKTLAVASSEKDDYQIRREKKLQKGRGGGTVSHPAVRTTEANGPCPVASLGSCMAGLHRPSFARASCSGSHGLQSKLREAVQRLDHFRLARCHVDLKALAASGFRDVRGRR